ncbi:MAG: DUF167 domain-containing protein [Verrucomicrobia bacterium]|nr:DUF167 domain-containing protein [Verrucomicrobiota bacterium]
MSNPDIVRPMTANPTIISVRVKTRAHTNSVEGWIDGVLHVRLRAIPEKGRANEALIELLADHFSVAKSDIEIVSGSKGSSKRIRLPIGE